MLKWEKLRWLANRLMSMSAPEIIHRVKERRRRAAGRAMGGWSRYELDTVEIVPFTISATERQDLAAQCRADWTAIYELSRAGQWLYLGQRWPGVTSSAVWHLDPVSGKPWPSDAYCFDVDFRHEAERGDVKYVWELNRLQFLPPIAAMASATGDAGAARYCIDTILNWAEANPPFQGVNWSSGIELALRAISILLTVSLLGPDRLSDAERKRIGTILNAHAVWLTRYPSLYSSANNHLVAEAAGLYVLGTLVPSLPQAERYRAYGRRVLTEEVDKQILPDGVGAEQSPTYTAFTAELYAIALAAARATGEAFPSAVESRLGKALEFLRWITDDGGNQPRFGDDDEGRVVTSLPHAETHYVSSIMSGLAAMTGQLALAPPMAVPHLRDLFLGKAGSAMGGPGGLRAFDDGGYSVFRQQLAGHNAMLVLDHGPLGYLSIAAHGHADALAIWLHVDGRPVLIDAGTYLYHSGGAERDHFRGTGAHNTLQINGANQSRIVGAFNWSHKARAWRVPESGGADGDRVVTARHDGYRKRFGVVHERRVARDETGFTVTDRLEGALSATTDTTLRFYLDPSITAQREAAGIIVLSREGQTLLRLSFNATSGDTITPELVPAEISPQFGIKQPSTLIALALPPSTWRDGGGAVTRIQFS